MRSRRKLAFRKLRQDHTKSPRPPACPKPTSNTFLDYVERRTLLAGLFALNITTQPNWTNVCFRINQRIWWLLVILFLSHSSSRVIGLASPTKRQKAPRPENLPNSEVIEPDAFRLLIGPKPDFTVTPQSKRPTETIQIGSELTWSQLISGSTLDDEIKTAMPRLKKIVATKTFFDSHIGDAIDEFRLLSICFGIISAYDKAEDVRSSWKRNAIGYRERFERSAYRCDREGAASFATATTSVRDLENLIRGEASNFKSDETKPFQWSQLCERSLLMRRLKLADEQLTSGTASADSFSDSTDQLVHAAEIVACFGELLVQPEFVDWDDSDYKVHAEKMKTHALEVRTAISEGNYDDARNSAKAISQACSACHADYR